MTILGIILILVGIMGFVSGMILADKYKPHMIFLCHLILIIPIGVGLITCKTIEPTKQDVLDGKAYYQETQIITGNDTIKTYDIVWKQENF